jgi:short-subunit dehydrogenase
MTKIDWNGQWVLVTGASAGIGRQFAVQLAQRGANLVLCARNEQRLRELGDELKTEVRIIAADLATPTGVQHLLDRLDALDVSIDHVVNNAGIGGAGHFARQTLEQQIEISALNCDALLRITRHLLPGFLARQSGGFIQIASTAAFQPVPYMALYGATKAYVLHLTQAIAEEIRDSGVRMLALCPGPVPTEFQERAGYTLTGMQKKNHMSAEAVAHKGLVAYERGQRVCVPGFTNSAQTFVQRFFPRDFITWASAVVMKRSGRDQVE